MRALSFHKRLKFRKDYPIPQRAEGEALIRVLQAGICNTDIEIVRGYMPFQGVLGHEFVGVVEEAGDKTWIGKRVVGEINCPCGGCEYCRQGLGNHCPNRKVLGILGKDGAFADYVTLPMANLHELPASISNLQAVFVEPIASAFRILEQVDIGPKDRVAVLGDGKLGLLVAQVMASTGCELTAVGRHPEKLEILAKRKIKTRLVHEGPYQKFDLCIDCTGSPKGLELALDLVRPMGKIVLKSTFARGERLNLSQLVVNEVVLLGSRCGPFKRAIEALQDGAVEVDNMVTKVYNLGEATKAFSLASRKGVLKVVLYMT
ncbi:MAG: alcohol dehydrogenase catalytic domain-containing protein [Candidatus Brocadiaceae bacterium]|nr:alcohol dehydrogenase catalytic domain-containing protein [Candidatus Brocadiaceae bacterium]